MQDPTFTVAALNDRVTALENASGSSALSSYVGMIIHSYTLDTEAKVIEIYGGTSWTRMNNSRFLMDNNGSAGSIGGNNSVTLSVSNMPSHNHKLAASYIDYIIGMNYGTNTGSAIPSSSGGNQSLGETMYEGSGTSFSVLNQYIVVYIWRRAA